MVSIYNILSRTAVVGLLLLWGVWAQAQRIAISEVRADTGGRVTIEITNYDDLFSEEINDYWLWNFPNFNRLDSLEILCGSLDLGPGESVTLSGFRADGEDGELALYSEMRFLDSTAMVDYVLWGDVPQRQATEVAVEAGQWVNNDVVPSFTVGRSIQYDGEGDRASDWSVSTIPSICIAVNCEVEGGSLSYDGNTDICGTGSSTDLIAVELNGAEAPMSTYVITDADEVIQTFQEDSIFRFGDFPTGESHIWHIGHDSTLAALEVGTILGSGLVGCFDVSDNFITIQKSEISGGIVSTSDNTIICPGDRIRDFVFPVSTGAVGTQEWVVTDLDSTIVQYPVSLPIAFETFPEGSYLIWNVSYDQGFTGLSEGANLNTDLSGCFALSNPVSVFRFSPTGGVLSSHGDTAVCLGAGRDVDIVVDLDSSKGIIEGWIVTDTTLRIIDMPSSRPFDFSAISEDHFFLWHYGALDTIGGLGIGASVENLDGCFGLSNPLAFSRSEVDGGIIDTENDLVFCDGDSIPDSLSFMVSNAQGAVMSWLVMNDSMRILGIYEEPVFGLAEFGLSEVYVAHVSYDISTTGISVGNMANERDIDGCYSMSNILRFSEETPRGGEISLVGDSIICIQDGQHTSVSVEVVGAMGSNMAWILTDSSDIIRDIIPSGETVELSGELNTGLYRLRHLSYADNIQGLDIGARAFDTLEGCLDWSNSISLSVRNVYAGTIMALSDTIICVGEGELDSVIFAAEGAIGDIQSWVITDTSFRILAVQDQPFFNFESTSAGVSWIWHIAYSGQIVGLDVGESAEDLMGCYSLSNAVTIVRDTMGIGACLNTSVHDEVSDRLSVEIFPNPFSHEFYVDLRALYDPISHTDILLYDSKGALIERQSVQVGRDEHRVTITSDRWAIGTYHLRIVTPYGSYARTIIKTR